VTLIAIGAGRSQQSVEINRRLDLAKLLDQVVAFLAWRKRFDVGSNSAGQIDQPGFKCRIVADLMALHGLTPGLQVRGIAGPPDPTSWDRCKTGSCRNGRTLRIQRYDTRTRLGRA
jgi:hypothetical protein